MTIPATSQKKAASASDCEDCDGGSSGGSSSGVVVVGKDHGKTSSEGFVRSDGEGETDSASAGGAHSQEKNGIQRRSPSDVDSGRVSGTLSSSIQVTGSLLERNGISPKSIYSSLVFE